MSDPDFSARTHREGSDAVLAVAGELDLSTVPQLAEAFDRLLGGDKPERAVVDLAGIEFVDSSGLTALLRAQRRAQEADVGFVLRSPGRRVRRALELTKLDSVFEIEEQPG